MPLSQTQIAALKSPETAITIQQENPKKPGTKAHERFEKYKGAETIGDAMSKGANWQDLSGDFEKSFSENASLHGTRFRGIPKCEKSSSGRYT